MNTVSNIIYCICALAIGFFVGTAFGANTQEKIDKNKCNNCWVERPAMRGEWQEGEFKYLTCSVCGCDTNLYDQHGFPIGQRKGHPYPCFCPHCGADMRGADE